MTTATLSAVSREVLEDRYDGLVWDGRTEFPHDGKGPLGRALTRVLMDLVAGTARCHPDDAGHVVDELLLMIHAHVIQSVDEMDIAR